MKNLLTFALILTFAIFTYGQKPDDNSQLLKCNPLSGQAREMVKIQDETLSTAPFMHFWRRFSSYAHKQTIDLNKTYRLHLKGDFPSGKISEGDISFRLNSARPELLELLRDFTVAVDQSNLLKILALEKFGEKITGAELEVDFGETEVELKLLLKTNSENTSERATTRLKTLFMLTGSFFKSGPAGEFYKNAEISAKKDRISVRAKISKANFIRYLREI